MDRVLVLYTELGRELSRESLLQLEAPLPPALRQGIGRYLRWQDRQSRLLAWALLRRGLVGLGHAPGLEGLQTNPYGRPGLPGGPEFNLSHSGQVVVCALTLHGRLGVDVEQVRPLDLADFASCFNPAEWEGLQKSGPDLAAFFRLWTAKEAVAKAEGLGLSLPLREILLQEGRALCRGRAWLLKELNLLPGHPGALALSGQTEPSLELRKVELGLA